MVATTPITPLPKAPSRADGREAFNQYSDPFIAAMPPMVVQINERLVWIADQVTACEGYKSAAAASATNAATSATTAGQKVTLAAAEVTKAVTARQGAEAARDAAQVAAQAAGAAAGLPAARVPFTVLQVNAAGNVAWGYGVPDTSAALAGQALILGAGKVPGWGYPAQQIGDVLYTSRNPGAGYLPASGGVYLQSAYPQLFALVGLLGGLRLTSFVSKASTPVLDNFEFGENGVVLAYSTAAGTVNNIYRSTDYGNTFSLAVAAVDAATIGRLMHLGGVIWLALLGTAKVLRSTDNGSTWAPINVSGTPNIGDSDKNGTVIIQTSTSLLRSVNNGATFSALSNYGFSLGAPFKYVGNNRWVAAASTTALIISDDAFSSYSVKPLNGTINGSMLEFGADLINGVIVGISSNGGPAIVNMALSFDRGDTWGVGSSGAQYPLRAVVFAGLDTWLLYSAQSNTAYETRKSTNGAKTFVSNGQIGSFTSYGRFASDSLKGQVIVATGVSGANGYLLSAPTLPYDGATQFKVPSLAKQEGVNPYVRAA